MTAHLKTPVQAPAGELSGPQWVAKFPTSKSVADLVQPFRDNVTRFLQALSNAHASVSISATYRPVERAYLMHWAWAIAREHKDPAKVPPQAGVNIRWLHTNSQGQPDLAASRHAAEQMVSKYGIVHPPALTSRHTQRLAIDMNISWTGTLAITDGKGKLQHIKSTPRTGAGNHELYAVGNSYGVHKLVSDAPHWSNDGH